MEENIFDTEIGKKILALTKASFRVSDLISDLIFREKIKHQILTVFEKSLFIHGQKNFIQNLEKNYSELLKEIDTLDHYFYLGGHLGLVKEEYLKSLRNGFLVFKSHIVLLNNNTNDTNKNTRITRIIETEFSSGDSVSNDERIDVQRQKISDVGYRINGGAEKQSDLTAKQKKILEKFEMKDTLRLSEIMEIFPDVSERTVRNELSFLVNLGKITRSGIGSGSFYRILK